jgi:hypothetical protein
MVLSDEQVRKAGYNGYWRRIGTYTEGSKVNRTGHFFRVHLFFLTFNFLGNIQSKNRKFDELTWNSCWLGPLWFRNTYPWSTIVINQSSMSIASSHENVLLKCNSLKKEKKKQEWKQRIVLHYNIRSWVLESIFLFIITTKFTAEISKKDHA